MAKYKEKYKQIIINAAKQPTYYFKDDVVVFNLNSCFTKLNNFARFTTCLKEALEERNKLNLCNLASLCHRLNMEYTSQECLDFIQKVKDTIVKEFPNVEIMQSGICTCEEVDLQPISKVIKLDSENNTVYVNVILVDSLNILGYANNQIYSILDFTKDFNIILPKDVKSTLPINTPKAIEQYEKIRGILGC